MLHWNWNHKIRYRVITVGVIGALLLPMAISMGEKKDIVANAAIISANGFGSVNLLPLGILGKTYDEKLKEAEQRKKELEQKKTETQANIKELEKKKSDILSYIEELDEQLNVLTAQLEELDADILDTKAELETTQKDLEAAKEKEANQYEMMKRRIQYLYENGSENMFEVFLTSGNIVEFLNQVEYAKKISEYDNNMLLGYIATKELIIEQEAYLAAKLEELQYQEETKLYEQNTLLELSAAKGEEILRYSEAIGADEELFAEYAEEIVLENKNIEEIKEEEKKRIEEEKRRAEEARKAEEARLAALRAKEEQERLEAANNIQVSGETSIEKMIWPLPGDGRVYSKFGPRKAPTAGASTYHRGVDIGGVQGASIVASLAGVVETASYSVSGGNYVVINHGNGVTTRYLHCSKLLVKKGQTVQQGEVIAKVGSTGISTGPHLHFSLLLNGTHVDPLLYVSYK